MGFSSITGDETIMSADNCSFDGTERGGKMTANGQLWTGATAVPHVRTATLTAGTGISITNGSGSITIASSSTSGSRVLISSQNASSSATIDITGLTTTYYMYELEYYSILPSSATADGFLLRAGTGGGPTYDTGNNYNYAQGQALGGGMIAQGANPTSSISLAQAPASHLSTTIGCAGRLYIFNIGSATERLVINGTGNFVTGAGDPYAINQGGYWNPGGVGAACTALRLLFNTGNIASGTIKLWGLLP